MTIQVRVYDIDIDGLPDMDKLTNRVAFIWNGAIFSGWPLNDLHLKYPENNHPIYSQYDWECSEDRVGGVFRGIKKYIIFDKPISKLESEGQQKSPE